MKDLTGKEKAELEKVLQDLLVRERAAILEECRTSDVESVVLRRNTLGTKP